MTDVVGWIKHSQARSVRVLVTSAGLLVTGISIPVAAYFGFLKPEDELTSDWFQRSGALVVFFAIWAEYRLQSIEGLVAPSGLASSEWAEFKKYRPFHSAQRWIGLLLALAGTFIWGYGDLILDHV